MTETTAASDVTQVAYYYPEPYWDVGEVDAVKTLLLFFDGIATLLPRYMRGRETTADPVLALPLAERGLLKVLEPETFIDQQLTEELSTSLVDLITEGAFDELDRDVKYAELSHSRLGWNADVSLAGMVIEELMVRGLAKASRDGVSVPLHPVIRTTVLVLLSQLARSAGQRNGMNLHPTAGRVGPVRALMHTLALAPLPSVGHLVALDVEIVTVNLATVPLDEILDFRVEHGSSYRAYARDLRDLVIKLGPLAEPDRLVVLSDRQEALADQAADLRNNARRAWNLPFASFALGVAGAAWEAIGKNDPLTAMLALGAGVAGALSAPTATAGAYSYLFEARTAFEER